MILTPHPAALRQAAEALVRDGRLPLGAVASELGLPLGTIRCWTLRGGWRRRLNPPARASKGAVRRRKRLASARSLLDGPALRVALLGHVARQIARFDAALEAEALPDSARVLRDLGGLKKLLDELAAHHIVEAGGRHGADAGADEPGEADLPALRARIAARYEAFAGERPHGGLPGEPAGAPAAGARP